MNGLNLSKFKKIASDSKSTTLKHPEGHKIIIAHHALSPNIRKQVKALPSKYAEGGDVGEDSNRSPASVAPATDDVPWYEKAYNYVNDALALPDEREAAAQKLKTDQAASNLESAAGPAVAMPPRGPAPASMEQPSAMAGTAPLAASQADPMGLDKFSSSYMKGLDEQKAGLNQEAAAQGDLGRLQTDTELQQQQMMKQANADYQKHFAGLQNEYKAVLDDVKNQHINPNHYMESMSTGKRVSTAIGLILGGMGAGLTGGENPALKFLNEQIARDVDSQKADLGTKQTLLSANLKQFGNLHDATQMTYALQNGIYASKLREAAAQTLDPLAKARAIHSAGQLDMQAAPIIQQMAQRKTMMGMMSSSQGKGDPSSMVRFLVPEHHQKAVFDEIERAQDTKRMSNSILDSFDQAAQDNTVMRTGAGMLRTPPSVFALHQSMQPTFKDLEGTVRQAAMDNTFRNITPAAGDMDSTIKTKRAALVDYLRSKSSAPTAKGFGIDLDKFASTRPVQPPAANEGMTASDGKGRQIIMKGGRWVPYGG